jgi:hypothetical protein
MFSQLVLKPSVMIITLDLWLSRTWNFVPDAASQTMTFPPNDADTKNFDIVCHFTSLTRKGSFCRRCSLLEGLSVLETLRVLLKEVSTIHTN